ISNIAKDLDKFRKYVVSRRLVGIPSEIRAKVKETPQYLRATSFASMDTPGPFEKRATEAYYYVTPTEEDWPQQEKEEWLTAFDPCYLNYTLGKLQILKLLDDYKAQQGNEFSLQKFHNELLSHGMPPIRLLREIMLKDQSKWDQVL